MFAGVKSLLQAATAGVTAPHRFQERGKLPMANNSKLENTKRPPEAVHAAVRAACASRLRLATARRAAWAAYAAANAANAASATKANDTAYAAAYAAAYTAYAVPTDSAAAKGAANGTTEDSIPKTERVTDAAILKRQETVLAASRCLNAAMEPDAQPARQEPRVPAHAVGHGMARLGNVEVRHQKAAGCVLKPKAANATITKMGQVNRKQVKACPNDRSMKNGENGATVAQCPG